MASSSHKGFSEEKKGRKGQAYLTNLGLNEMKTQGDLNFDQNRSNMGNASSHSVECIPSKKGNTHFSMGKIKCGTRSTEITCPTCGKRWKRRGPCLTPRLSIWGGKIPPKMENNNNNKFWQEENIGYFGGSRRMLGYEFVRHLG